MNLFNARVVKAGAVVCRHCGKLVPDVYLESEQGELIHVKCREAFVRAKEIKEKFKNRNN